MTEIFISVHSSGELDKVLLLLVIVVFITFHDDVLTKVFISVHAGGKLNESFVLVIMIFITFHDDVLTKVFVSVHSCGEKAIVSNLLSWFLNMILSWIGSIMESFSDHVDVSTDDFSIFDTSFKEGDSSWSGMKFESGRNSEEGKNR